MTASDLINKRNLLYYMFAAFIVAIFMWWWVLLFQKNINVYNEKLALYNLIIDIDDSETTMQLYNQEVTSLNAQHNRQKTMITWEGLTFLLLLIFGIVRLNRYLHREIALARQQSNFLLSITHELKSPLASALLNIQTLQKRRTLEPDKQERLLNNSKAELSRLEELVGKLLFAAKIDDGPIYHEMAEVDLSALYMHLLSKFKDQYSSEFNIDGNLEDDLVIIGDEVLLASIFTNLVDNAAKYCSPAGDIQVNLIRAGNAAIFTVANDGQPIDENEKAKIWQKFYRIGDENTRSSIGTGLGLYIVRRVVESHRGKVAVANKNEGNGVVFTVELPLVKIDSLDEAV